MLDDEVLALVENVSSSLVFASANMVEEATCGICQQATAAQERQEGIETFEKSISYLEQAALISNL